MEELSCLEDLWLFLFGIMLVAGDVLISEVKLTMFHNSVHLATLGDDRYSRVVFRSPAIVS